MKIDDSANCRACSGTGCQPWGDCDHCGGQGYFIDDGYEQIDHVLERAKDQQGSRYVA